MVETEQPKTKRIPPVRTSQPTWGIGERKRPNIPSKRVGGPNGNDSGDPDGNRSSHGHGSSSYGNRRSDGNGNSPMNGNPQKERNSQEGGGGSNGDRGSNGNGDLPDRRGGPPRENGNPDGGDGGSDPDDSGNGDDSSSSLDSTLPRRRRHRRPKYVHVLQGPPGPPGQEGQPGQPGKAGRDCRDGQAPPLTRALEEALRAQRTYLDTTGLENSLSQFGRTMFEVLKAQQRTNQNLEEQFNRANETQEFQTEAMQDMAQVNFQMKFNHMFISVPIYDGTDPDTFDNWLYQIESLCEMSHRDIRTELLGWASAQVKHTIRCIPLDIEWEVM